MLLTPSLLAQTWVKVATENDTVTSTTAVTYRYGAGTSWTAPQTSSGTIQVTNATFGDPAPNVVKELDVLETSASQAVTVNGQAVTIPALPTPTVTSAVTASVATSAPTVTIPKQSASCTIPRNGGTCTISFPQQILPVGSSLASYAWQCKVAAGTKIMVAADGTVVIPPLACTAVKQ